MTVPHDLELSCDVTQLQCHQHFTWRLPHFYGSSGRSRIDFVATPPSVQFSRIFVKISAGRRLQLIPSTGPRDHMPARIPREEDGDHEKIEEVLSDPIARLAFFQELETNIHKSTIVGRAATDDTPDDAWENLVRIIQETAGPYFCQGAPRFTRPLALERRRLLKDLDTARRLTGVSTDQTLVENAKIEGSRVEKQMRRLSRRANWLEEVEKGQTKLRRDFRGRNTQLILTRLPQPCEYTFAFTSVLLRCSLDLRLVHVVLVSVLLCLPVLRGSRAS